MRTEFNRKQQQQQKINAATITVYWWYIAHLRITSRIQDTNIVIQMAGK